MTFTPRPLLIPAAGLFALGLAVPFALVDSAQAQDPLPVESAEAPAMAESETFAVQAPAAPLADGPEAATVASATTQPAFGSDEVSAALETAIAAGSGARKDNAIANFYGERAFAPVWIEADGLGASARDVIQLFGSADEYGLEPGRYAVPAADAGADQFATPDEAAAAEIALTAAALRFAGDAQGGTFDPVTLGEFMSARPVRPRASDVLGGLADAPDRAAYLAAFNPPHPQFEALRKLLVELKSRTSEDVPPMIGEGPSLKPGARDERVPVIRARLNVPAVEGIGALDYDDAVVDAVKAFQEEASLDVDGVIGPQTRAALNGGAEVTVSDVLVNMERWRWMPRDMGEFHVWVNIPEYKLRIVDNGTPFFDTRVIVGTSENQTPVFSDEIEYVDVNPFWNVPRSIAVKEMMPHIRKDPGYITKQGLQVLYMTGGREFLINPYSVDWTKFDPENMPFRFRQPPGNSNALGRVKFMFPNKHAVYLHDTPTRNLFSRSVRSFSHGCVRVDKPVEFADALLKREEQINGERIMTLINGGENGSLPIKRHIPVHLTYFTVWVDAAGETQKRSDIYDYDSKMKSSMGLGS